MKKIVYLSGVIIYSTILNAQTNVFECTPQNSTFTQQEFVSNEEIIKKPCVRFESNTPYIYVGNQDKTIIGINNIHITSKFHAKTYLVTSSLHLKSGNKADFEVVSMNYTDLTQVLKLKKFELGITLPNDIQEKVDQFMAGNTNPDLILNPYMDWDLRVYVEYAHPNISEPILIDGFYNQEYEAFSENPPPDYDGTFPEEYAPDYNNGFYITIGKYNELPTPYPFLIRFSPPELGKWEAKVKIVAPNLYYESESFNFTVVESGSLGYVNVGNNFRYLQLNNTGFYPLGANVLWPTTSNVKNNEGYKDTYLENVLTQSNGDVLSEDYRQLKPIPRIYNNHRNLIRNIADGGGNFVRLIMHPFSQDIEWEKLGDYTERLNIAQEMDQTLEYCESRGLYIDWDFQIQYVLSNGSYRHSWDGTPYGKEYCYKLIPGVTTGANFFTNSEAKKFFKQKLRYVLARWGYSTSIAMFELFSEINSPFIFDRPLDLSTTGDLEDRLPLLPEQYEIIEDWHNEMAAFVKSIYNGKTHLVLPSYIFGKTKQDATFSNPNIDLMGTNVYSGLKTYAKEWIGLVQKERLDQKAPNYSDSSFSINCTQSSSGYGCNYVIKPFFVAEFNPLAETCDEMQIEVKRSMWQIPFSGLAGALPWDSYKNGIVFSEFGKINQFMSQINLNSGDWHPGAMERIYGGRWVYKDTWANDMDKYTKGDNAKNKTYKADLMYLRSQDQKNAIGVITNKTYNIYNSNDDISCDALRQKWDNLYQNFTVDDDQYINPPLPFQAVKINGNNNDVELKLHGMKTGKYIVEYYNSNNPTQIVSTSEDNGPIVKIETTIGGNAYDYIMLFKAYKKNTNKSIDEEENLEDEPEDREDYIFEEESLNSKNIEIYPNPTNSSVSIRCSETLKLYVYDNMGKLILSDELVENNKLIDINNFEKGVYSFKCIQNDGTTTIKKIVKL